jgi:hypothetical protein
MDTLLYPLRVFTSPLRALSDVAPWGIDLFYTAVAFI